MYLFDKNDREKMMKKLEGSWKAVEEHQEEAHRIRARLIFLDREIEMLEEEEALVKRAYRIQGKRGNYSLAGPNDILDCDY